MTFPMTPSVQSPSAYDRMNLQRAQLAARLFPQTEEESANSITPEDEGEVAQLVPLERFGARANGTDCNLAVEKALNSGEHLLLPRGRVYSVEGDLEIVREGQVIAGPGCFKKLGSEVLPIFRIADGLAGVKFKGVKFDGTRANFATGNAVPAVIAYLLRSVDFVGCNFIDFIDSPIKLRDCAGLLAMGNRFFNISENGIELQNYTVDVRTGLAYVGSRPSIEGGHRIIANHFELIDDGLHGTGNGCGVLMASNNTSYPLKNIKGIANDFVDVLLSIWTENNTAGAEARNVAVHANNIYGNVRGAGTVETSDGIGLIGVIGGSCTGNTLHNVGNITPPPGGDTSGITVSGTSTDIELAGNTIIDDTGNAVRTDYGIVVANGTRIHAHHNTVKGCSTANLFMDSAGCVDCRAYANPGAEGEYSWGAVVPFIFTKQNIPASTTNVQCYPCGQTDWDEVPVPVAGRLVGVSILLSAAISAGNMTVKVYSGGVQRTNLNITQADFGGGVQATKKIATESGVTVPSGSRLKVYLETDGSFAPTTDDAIITLLFDTSANVE